VAKDVGKDRDSVAVIRGISGPGYGDCGHNWESTPGQPRAFLSCSAMNVLWRIPNPDPMPSLIAAVGGPVAYHQLISTDTKGHLTVPFEQMIRPNILYITPD